MAEFRPAGPRTLPGTIRKMFFTNDKTKVPSPETALPGRPEYAFEIPGRHAVLCTPLRGPYPEGTETASFAMGCFWGAERLFWQLDGIHTTAVGYQNGFTPHPTYEEVCSGRTGHAEAVLVVFDPSRTSYGRLLEVFFSEHDPTQGMRQGNDVGSQYRSAVFTYSERQQETATAARDAYQLALAERGLGQITTEIEPAGPFYFAEGPHQQYLDKVPGGYCGLAGTGVACQVPAAGK